MLYIDIVADRYRYEYRYKCDWFLFLGRKAMTNLDSVLKYIGITLLTKAPIDKAMVFPVAIYGCESWTIQKKAEHRELMPSNCSAGEHSWEFLGQQGDQTSQS